MHRILCHPALCLAVLAAQVASACADEIRPTFAMFQDPEFHIPPVEWKLPEEYLRLWREALARPEADYQRAAALTIIRAHSEGLAGMESARPELLAVLTNDGAHRAARFAAARALIALDSRDAAEPLFQTAQRFGADLRSLVEPALAEWDFPAVRPVWRSRLEDPEVRRRDLLLAVEGLGRVRDRDALPPLVEIARNVERPADIRLAAARAAGAIATSGLEQPAGELASARSDPVLNRLCAVSLLSGHTSEAAREQLARLGRDAEPTVAAAALGILFSIDPQLVLPLAPEALENPDANVRLRAVDAYVALPTPERIGILAGVLDDVHPAVRGRVREALFVHARQAELDDAVRQSAMDVLHRDGWRGQEQAALLLAALDHKPAAGRLIELLESQRPEVMVATAWALKMLAVPETLPALLDKAERQTAARLKGTMHLWAVDRQVAHLFEAMGQMHYQPALPLLRRHVPKDISVESSRAAAVWALGLLYAGKPDDELAAQLIARAKDSAGMPPELFLVRLMSVISVGRMRAESQLSELRELAGPTIGHDLFDYALGWSIREISGEEVPLAPPTVAVRTGWFLEPLRDPSE